MSSLTDRIRSAGYFEVAIRPAAFNPSRVEFRSLFPIIEKCAVEVRGWDFPHIDQNKPPVRGVDHISQDSEWQHHGERWILFQSGLFALLRQMPSDWRDRSDLWPAKEGWKRGESLGIGEALFTLFEVFEFAARLSQTDAGDQSMIVSIEVGGLRGRHLVTDDRRRMGMVRQRRVADVDVYPFRPLEISRSDLIAQPHSLAVRYGQELFVRFGADINDDTLSDWLARLKQGG